MEKKDFSKLSEQEKKDEIAYVISKLQECNLHETEVMHFKMTGVSDKDAVNREALVVDAEVSSKQSAQAKQFQEEIKERAGSFNPRTYHMQVASKLGKGDAFIPIDGI